ncbi:amidohydrolase family protein [bacterium]|nr:amidohydrolase family protein [bacterium]MCG2676203.1 amidohydrolase family protein [bacterium]
MTKIWDAHSHWIPPGVAEYTSFFKRGWSDIDLLLNTLDNSGIEKAVLLYPTSDAHLKMGGWSKVCALYNEEISKQVKRHPERLMGAGILPVDRPKDMVREVERIRELGLSCLSLASSYEGRFLDDESFLPVLEKAEREKLPIFVHSQIINPIGFERIRDPLLMPVVEYPFDITMCAGKLMMSGRLSQLKNLKIIFAHFAGVLPFLGDRFDSTYLMLRAREMVKDLGSLPSAILRNIFVDTSGAKSASLLNMALDFFGPDRILWGSDFPAKKGLTESIEVLKDLNIEEGEKESILGGNLMNLFGEGE